MANNWSHDDALVDSIVDNLLQALPLFAKRLIRTDEIVRDRKLPFSNIQILIMLRGGEMSISELSAKLGIAKPNVTPLVDRLMEAGLVERVRSPKDRRIVNVHLCDKGQEELVAIRAAIRRQVLEWDKRYNRSEARELNSAIARIYSIITAG